MIGYAGVPVEIDKDAMRRALRAESKLTLKSPPPADDAPPARVVFYVPGRGPDGPHHLDARIWIEPRSGDRWRVEIADTWQLGPNIVHVADIHTTTTSPIELLRVALEDYRAYRPLDRRPAPEPEGLW